MTYRTARPGGFVAGQFKRVCDRTGRILLARDTRKEWNGLIVDKNEWEPRHPQEFVRGVPDDQSVPEPRPYPEPNYVDPGDITEDDF